MAITVHVAVHTVRGVAERVFDRPAEANLGEHPLQLLAHRVGGLLRDGLQALHQREPRAQRARQERERVGQLALEAALALPVAVIQVREGADGNDAGCDDAGERPY
jgi:hypothetical protein